MSDKPIVVITGSRRLLDEQRVSAAFWMAAQRACINIDNFEEYEWHHGAASQGVDSIVDEGLRSLGIEPIKHVPDYKQFGRQAPHIRNNWMLDLAKNSDGGRVIAIWSGAPGGTSSVIHKAASKGIPVFVEVLSR